MSNPLSRRRFLCLAASAVSTPAFAGAGTQLASWRGVALGAGASMQLAGVTQQEAEPIFAETVAEISRLEDIFSLYRPQSSVSRLNMAAKLDAPAPELLEVLSVAHSAYNSTSGAFNPCIQPVWQLQAATLGRSSPELLYEALARSDWRQMDISASQISFGSKGMALTLNGIAQGYITDRISALLRARGFENILVNMGEISASGNRPDGTRWNVGIAWPDGQLAASLELRNRAIATSAPSGTSFDAEGLAGHILDPRTGLPGAAQKLVSVSAENACLADALSTAFCLMTTDEIHQTVARLPGVRLEQLVTDNA